MAKLTFQQDANGQDTKVALTMISKDGESVNCHAPCDCDGQVKTCECAVHRLPVNKF
jgi:hypothetical protein